MSDVDDAVNYFCFDVTSEKFYLKRHGKWDLSRPVGPIGVANFSRTIAAEGTPLTQCKKLIADGGYLTIQGFRFEPNQPSVLVVDGLMYMNLWQKPKLVPRPGGFPSISRILDFLCNHESEGVAWVTHWLARKMQNPGLLSKVAVLFVTKQGGGKGILYSIIAQMLGEDNCANIGRADLESAFNSAFATKLFVLGDELATSDRSKDITQVMKKCIDSNTQVVNQKNMVQYQTESRITWMFASNDFGRPIRVEKEDRRFSVFMNSEEVKGTEYQQMLLGLFNKEKSTEPTPSFQAEIEGFFDYLLNLKVNHELVSLPYSNESRQGLIQSSVSSVELYHEELLEDGYKTVEEHCGLYPNPTASETREYKEFLWVRHDVLFRTYQAFCKARGMKAFSQNSFLGEWSHLIKHTPWHKKRLEFNDKKFYTGYCIKP
jgi:hypothetical protein